MLVPLDRRGIDRVWDPSGYPSHGDYRDTNRLTPRAHQAVGQRRRAVRPGARPRPGARARARRSSRVADGAVVAFDTELFGHYWHEGITFLEARARAGRVEPLEVPERRCRARRRPADELGRRPRPAHVERRARLGPAPRRAARAQRAADPRALRELLALQSSDWAFQIYNAHRRRLPARARRGAPCGVHDALARAAIQKLRNLAPQLANWAFVQP